MNAEQIQKALDEIASLSDERQNLVQRLKKIGELRAVKPNGCHTTGMYRGKLIFFTNSGAEKQIRVDASLYGLIAAIIETHAAGRVAEIDEKTGGRKLPDMAA